MNHYIFIVINNIKYYLNVITLISLIVFVLLYTLSCFMELTDKADHLMNICTILSIAGILSSCLIPEGNALWIAIAKLIGEAE